MAWMAHLWSEKTGRLSFQVLNEFYVTVTQKLQPGMDPHNAREDVRFLLAWHPVSIDARVFEGAWRIQDRYKLSWWDALIVSAAHASGCRYLLTEDFQENQSMGDVVVINPFHTAPQSITGK
jgi:predicted nucleic acid-binding protein